MNEPAPDAAKSSMSNDSAIDRDFGATGVFKIAQPPTDSSTSGFALGIETTEDAKPQPVFAEQANVGQSPDGISGSTSTTGEPPVTGSGGFTQLLRTLGSKSPSYAIPAAKPPTPDVQPLATNSGFTSLLQKLDMPVPAELLRDEPDRVSVSDSQQIQIQNPREPENKPGGFTQLFGTFGGAAAAQSEQTPSRDERENSRHITPGSFTQMLSLVPQSGAANPPSYEERKPGAGSVDYAHIPDEAGLQRESRSSFSLSGSPEAKPPQNTPPESRVGITRLIQMLDSPSKASDSPVDALPPSPSTGAGVWTQTFASLSTTNEPVAPSAAPLPPQSVSSPVRNEAATSAETQLSVPMTQPGTVSSTSGQSEFTRILDASRMREHAIKSELATGTGNPGSAAPPPNHAALPSPVTQVASMPVYPQIATLPPGMHYPSGHAAARPPMPGVGMNYGTPAGMISPQGTNMAHQPGAQALPAMATTPPVPSLKSAQPPMGKLQQYVPMMLVLIIALLIALLVTVIFLMKHN